MNFLFLLKNPNMRRLVSANLLSGIGDWFNSVAVLSLLLQITGEALAVGITLALRTLPHLLFGPLGGYLADRFSRKSVMIVCDLARGLIALCFLLVASDADVWLVYAGTFLLVAFSSLYNPSRLAILPDIVDKSGLASANALDQSVLGIVMAIGSLVGGFFVALWGSEVAFWFNSLSFFVSAFLLQRLTVATTTDGTTAPAKQRQVESQARDSASYKKAWQQIRATPVVLVILLLTALWPIGGGLINVLISVYAYQVFAAGQWGIGLLYGAIGVGFIAGGIVAQQFQRHTRAIASASFAFEGFFVLLTSVSPSIFVTAACYACSTVAGGMGNASLNTLLMKYVKPDYLGRVFALEATLSNVLLGLSMLAGGWILTFADPRIVGFAAGAFVTTCSICLGLLIWRAARTAEMAETADDQPAPSRSM
ncbi:MFS transporter [Brevibacillus parabrevis]|uniref:MFS transporter n=1 Tax=Brevibacillus parabrevis TaxID=54914 RepID=UPI002E1FC0FA|nr:MFS transporter [Brevibacillus parabrevis]